jgi:transcriptional regulator of met regulon
VNPSPTAIISPARSGIESRAWLLLCLLLGFVANGVLYATAFGIAQWPYDKQGYLIGRDHANIMVATTMFLEGRFAAIHDRALYMQEIARHFGAFYSFQVWSYPPSTALFYAPLTVFGLYSGLFLFLLAGTTALSLTVFMQLRGFRQSLGLALLSGLALVFSPASFINAVLGQNGLITAFLLVMAVLLVEKRPVLAGLALGLMVLKPHLAVIIGLVFLARGAWRGLAVAALTGLGIVLISVLAFGFEPWRLYLSETVPYQGFIIRRFLGFFTYVLISPYAAFRFIGAGHGLALTFQITLSLAIAVMVVLAARRLRNQVDLLILAALGTVLVLPYVYAYDMPLVTAALLIDTMRHERIGRGQAIINGLVFLSPATALFSKLGDPALPVEPAILLIAFIMRFHHLMKGEKAAGAAAALNGPETVSFSARSDR